MATEKQPIESPSPLAPVPLAKPRLPTAPPHFSDEAVLLSDVPAPGRSKVKPQLVPAPEEGELFLETVTDWKQLELLQAEWTDLAASAIEPNPFYEPWMLLPALRAFGAGRDLEVVLVFAPSRVKGRKQLCGLFPLVRQRGRVELWKHPYCYLSTPLLRRDLGRRTLAKFCDHLQESAGLVRFEDVPGDGAFRLLLVDELNQRGWTSCVSSTYTRAILKPARSGEEFLERALTGKRRKELRRQRSRLAELGTLTVEELQPGSDPGPWVREFLELEKAGWKGREGCAAAVRDGHQGFIEEAVRQPGAGERLMMLALRLDGKPIALKLNLLSGNGSFAFKIAFDESFSRFSPGVLLELENVRRLHELPRLDWMDSCAAPNRFMINHLWPDRRELQTLFFATGRTLPSLVVALMPLLQLLRAHLPRRARKTTPRSEP